MVGMRRLSQLALALAVMVGLASAARAAAELGPLRLDSNAGATILRVELTQPSEYRLFTLANPHRVVLDLLSARLPASALPLPAGHGAVRQVRAANRIDDSVRIVLDLEQAVQPQGALTRDAVGKGALLLVSLPVAGSASGKPVDLSPAAPLPAVDITPPAPAAEGLSAVPVKQRATGRNIIIAVDAGHGGKDPGAHGPKGVREKDITLRLSKQLVSVINAEPGMQAVLTRSTDEFIPLRGRMERARAAKADLFISIHADAVHNRSVRGSSIYVLNEKGATDEAARRLAARENAADLIGGVSLREHDRTLASVLLDLSQGAALSSSIDVAGDILAAMARVGTVRKPQVMQAPFMVLKSPDVPSVLIETAYISNPDEERRLNSATYRERLAAAIFQGVRTYFERNPPDGSLIAARATERLARGLRHTVRPGDSLSGLADRYGISIQRIREANALGNDRLLTGTVLRIPASQET